MDSLPDNLWRPVVTVACDKTGPLERISSTSTFAEDASTMSTSYATGSGNARSAPARLERWSRSTTHCLW